MRRDDHSTGVRASAMAAATLAAAMLAAAMAQAREVVPLPVEKPPGLRQSEPVPLPPRRPDETDGQGGETPPLPRPKPTDMEAAEREGPDAPATGDPAEPVAGEACPAVTAGRPAGDALGPIDDAAGCTLRAAYAIGAAGPDGAVALSPEAVVTCRFARALDGFVAATLMPLAREHLDAELAALDVSGSFVCRPRNDVDGADMSEHGRANAIDIAAFRLADGDVVSVEADWQDEGAKGDFLRAAHAAACGPFTTVLGPGSDAFHEDHFHFDLARRGADGRTTYCR